MKREWISGALQAAILMGCAPAEHVDAARTDALAQVAPAAPNLCSKRDGQATLAAPNILFLLDQSSSMAGLDPRNQGKNRWLASANAMRTVVSRFQGAAAFGLITFPSTVDFDGCGPGDVQVEIGLDAGRFDGISWSEPLPWSATPTARALDVAAATFRAGCQDCTTGSKAVVLITDGQPTCGPLDAVDPDDAAMAETISALERLTSAGVPTFVVGLDLASDPSAASTMESFAQAGGTGHAYAADDEASLITALSQVIGGQIPCAF